MFIGGRGGPLPARPARSGLGWEVGTFAEHYVGLWVPSSRDRRGHSGKSSHPGQRAKPSQTEENHARIPNLYTLVNEFIDRLSVARVIRHLPAPIGGCNVQAPPATGLLPFMAVGARCAP